MAIVPCFLGFVMTRFMEQYHIKNYLYDLLGKLLNLQRHHFVGRICDAVFLIETRECICQFYLTKLQATVFLFVGW